MNETGILESFESLLSLCLISAAAMDYWGTTYAKAMGFGAWIAYAPTIDPTHILSTRAPAFLTSFSKNDAEYAIWAEATLVGIRRAWEVECAQWYVASAQKIPNE